MLDLHESNSQLLAIVANAQGVGEAIKHDQITYLGFPFSISETFQQRNTNSSIEKSLVTVSEMLNACAQKQKTAVLYLSMAFGNPYGDDWNNEIAEKWTSELVRIGVKIISLADTTGVSTPEKINYLFPHLQKQFPDVEFGVHLHSTPGYSDEKLAAAWNSGCRRFDSALRGFGGCPMASDNLTGNIATEELISFLEAQEKLPGLNLEKWSEAIKFSSKIFN